MRPFFAAFCAISLAGCVTAAERETARSAWGDCITQAVKRLDDGKTDPTSVAYGISPQCAVQYQQLTSAMVGEMITENGQASMAANMRSNELKLITSAILINRSAQAKR